MSDEVPVLEEVATDVPSRRRRRRQLGSLAVAVALVAAGIAAAWATDGGGTQDREVNTATRVTAPPRDWDAECDNDGDSRNAPAADLPDDLRFFPTYVPDGLAVTSAGASVWPDHLGCHHGSVALILAEMDAAEPDRVARSIQVSGPSYREWHANSDDLWVEESVRVRGGQGIWRSHRDTSEWGWLFWDDSEGGRWTLQGARDQDEAVEVADRLGIDLDSAGPPVQLKDPPQPLAILWERPEPEGAGLAEEWGWGVTVEDPEKNDDPPMPPPVMEPAPSDGADALQPPRAAPDTTFPGPSVGISVQRMTTATTALTDAFPTARLIEVRGHRGIEHTDPNGSQSIVWDEEFGVQIRLSGSVGLRELHKIADGLELVDADDPRLVGVER